MQFADVNFKDLETVGFIVVTNFLTTELIEEILIEYNAAKASYNKNYNVGSFIVNENLKKQLSNTLAVIRNSTNIQVDLVSESGIYFDNSKVNFGWHQDHETYFKWQDSYNSLNFWIPIVKPIHNKSGISIVPFDKFEKFFPNLSRREFIGQGAKRIWPKDNKTIIVDDERGTTYSLPINLDSIMVTPDLNPGDLVILRADCIHRTQDSDTARIGVSIHCENGNNWLTREKFNSGSQHKKNMINKNIPGFKKIIDAFESNDRIQVKDVFN